MTQRQALGEFMNAFASALSAVVPSDVAVGVVGDWLVLTTRYGPDGYETAVELDDTADLNTIRGRVEGTLSAVQDIVTRHLTTPWPVTADGPLRSDSGNVVFPNRFVTTEGRTLRAFYAPRSEYVGWDYVEERIGDIVLALPPLSWPP